MYIYNIYIYVYIYNMKCKGTVSDTMGTTNNTLDCNNI